MKCQLGYCCTFLWIILNKHYVTAQNSITNVTVSNPAQSLDENTNTEASEDESSVFSGSTGETKPRSGRLPLFIRPSHYSIKLQPFINGNRTILGDIEIDIEIENNTNTIILNMVDIVTFNDSCKVVSKNSSERSPKVLKQMYDPELQFYSIVLDQTLSSGKNYTISVKFQGYLNSILVGFYLSTYKDASGNDHRLASTQFSPTDARRAFPCFDEPGFKATFDISLVRQENMTSLSNMPRIQTQKVVDQDGWFLDTFNTTLKMSTYLVGFLISDFATKSSSALNYTKFRVWSREDAINQTQYTLEVGPQLLLYLEDYFGIDFPLPKLDMAAVPNFKFSGMENWGLIMYRESAMLFDPLVSTVQSKRGLISVVAHEIAHMWFGNLVTPLWWSELWLKEGFANFMGYKAVDGVEPAWKMMDYLVLNSYHEAFALDSLRSSHPINVEVDRTDRISEIFDDISYSKGASIIRMMQHFLTEPVFKRGMTDYLRSLKFSNAVQDDLWRFLTKAWEQTNLFNSSITVKKVMDTWTLQDGFPVLLVARNGTTVTASQTRFLFDGLQKMAPDSKVVSNSSAGEVQSQLRAEQDERRWWIPVSFTKGTLPNFDATEPKMWFTPDNITVTITDTLSPSDWIILNVQKTGFYRVHYDPHTWSLLKEQLVANFSAIHPLNRAQLIDDSLNLARAGLMDYDLPLSLVKYIKDEQDLTPWTSFLNNFNYLYDMGKSTSQLSLFKKYLHNLIIPLFNATGFSDNVDDSYETQSLRIMATRWACELDYEPCVTMAKNLFNLWLTLPTNESSRLISSNVKPTVLCTGIKFSSPEIWNTTFRAYLDSNVQTEKTDILRALGCSKDSTTLKRYLDMALDSSDGIIKQDTAYVFETVSNSQEGRKLTWDIIKTQWNRIIAYFGSGSNALWRILEAPTSKFNTEELVLELKTFAEQNKDNLGSAQRTLTLSIESSELNVDWMKNRFPKIISVLQGA